MDNSNHKLPQMHGMTCITDGGMETDLLFNHGIDLPEFASYDLLRTADGENFLLEYLAHYVRVAGRYGLGLILETPTWRANRDWGRRIGDSPDELETLNVKGVELIKRVRSEMAGTTVSIVTSGCIGPRGDGYQPGQMMSPAEAEAYHGEQVRTLASAGADMITALTITYPGEAIGIVRAAKAVQLPVCISFTVETDARLPTGISLAEAIAEVDGATDNAAIYYMINCAHPTHFSHLFEQGGDWLKRLKGLRVNASCLSHAELDSSPTLDDGDPEALGAQLAELRSLSPHLTVLGGCCGTDLRHIESLAHRLSDSRGTGDQCRE